MAGALMVTRTAFPVPSMAKNAMPLRTVAGNWCSTERLSKIRVVRSTLEAHSAKWEAKEGSNKRLSAEDGRDLQSVVGGVVALGKFDALHVGHRALAERATEMGTPFLLSFSGMAEVLGWEPRLPVVAKCDRTRVMGLWAMHFGGVTLQEYSLDFSTVRSLSPQQFVEKLAKELDVKGVVAGANYRFGYRAAGDASDLVRLCQDYGLHVSIVDPVMDTLGSSPTLLDGSSREKGQVSSTRVRKALAAGNMLRVADLLGRKHRLIIDLDHSVQRGNKLKVEITRVLNQPPKVGSYLCTLVPKENFNSTVSELLVGQVKVEDTEIEIMSLDASLWDVSRSEIAIDFST